MKNLFLFILLCMIVFFNGCSNVGSLVELSIQKNQLENEILFEEDLNNFNLKTNKVEIATSSEEINLGKNPKVISNPKYKIGNPYEIDGIWYYPERDLNYSSTGIASWYGSKFHGKLTANGEIFNKNIISAAHRTLPMPSMVRVTNLNNGKVLNIRINDRGPYIHGRIIDLSEKAAELLGFKDLGIARVKVQVLMEQSLWLERSAKSGDFPVDNLKIRNNLLPEITPIIRPKVKIDQTSDNSNYNNEIIDNSIRNKKNSFTDLLAAGREGNLRQINPTETNIWIQIGAFSSRLNSKRVIEKISPIYDYHESTVHIDGKVLNRIRLGPTQDLQKADKILKQVYLLGFTGSKIIVE